MPEETPLPSWNDGAAKEAILAFGRRVAAAGVPPAERVAVFDNDGTLWCEKPLYIQLDFLLRRLAAMAEADAALREVQPWKAARERDYAWLGGAVTKHDRGDDGDVRVLLGGILRAHGGLSVEAFEAEAAAFLGTAQHPTLGRPYRACVYAPMVELLRYLEAGGFTPYIASGGGRDFMRPVTQALYGVPRERVIGSTVALRYEPGPDGGAVVRRPEADVLDDGPEKPVRIWSRIGRRPLLAAGNANGDVEMLQFAGGAGRPALRLLVRHDDGEREFAYTAGAERALERAGAEGWTVVSVRRDWATVF
jgi:phosphoglycolate phosphatase-like HAD superfamily hydrolase